MTMKTCNFCKKEKTIESFAFNDKAKNQRRSYCRACQSLKNAEYHRKPKDVKPPPETKVCTNCNQTKQITSFHWQDIEHTRTRTTCKDCHNEYIRALKRGEIARPPPPPKPDNIVKAPTLSIWDRPIYVPAKWNGPIR